MWENQIAIEIVIGITALYLKYHVFIIKKRERI